MTLPEHADLWMQQWRHAARALEEVRRRELATMDASAALAAAERVLAGGGAMHLRREQPYSGLVEQQRLLHRKRR